MRYPDKINHLIDSFTKLPGIGRKTAERYVFYLLKRPKKDLEEFAYNLQKLDAANYQCPECFNFTNGATLCPICSDERRDKSQICVVEEIHDLTVIENTGDYRGLYHILGGRLDPIRSMTPDKLTIEQLLRRIEKDNIEEVILALNPDIQGEGTILHLKKILSAYPVNLTILARGLPMGSDIEYADEVTLSNALNNRKPI